MEISIPHQLLEAAASLLLGVAAGFLYDFFRVIRRRLKLKIVTFLMDTLFWLICGTALFLMGLSLGGGEVRIFMMLLGILGAAVYFSTLSRLTVTLCEKLADFLYFVLICLLKPFVWAKILVKKIIDFAKKVFQYYRKWGKIKYHRLSVTSGRNKPAEKRKEQTEIEAQKGRYFYENHHSGSAGVRGGVPHHAAGKNRGRKGRAARAAAGDRR